MDFPIHLSTNKFEQSPKKTQNIGSVSKKKKDRENRNLLSLNDINCEWSQDEETIVVTMFLDAELQDSHIANVSADEEHVIVLLSDERNLKINLYERILPNFSFSSQNNHFTIKLTKCDASLHWPSLEGVRNSVKVKCSNASKNDIGEVSKNGVSSEQIVDDALKKNVVEVVNPKTNFVERNDDTTVYIYLYVNKIKKDTFTMKFCENMFSALFSTSDQNFLKKYPDTTESTVFQWSMQTKGELIPNQCTYRVSYANLEVKLKKVNTDIWESPSMPTSNLDSSNVTRNTWVPVTKTDIKKPSSIPPAPPAPPAFNEIKKPTSLLSSNKSFANSSNFAGFSLSSNMSSSTGSGAPVCPQGMTGLDNIGNTCFMNSVLQCLANNRELRDYFLECKFQDDLNKENPLGMGGKLALSFAHLMKVLWSGTTKSFAPSKLKSIMSLKANQFSGFAQHDAQEFMVELLDGLHEDLNRIKKKPYIADPPDLDGWTDHEAAEESWKLHKMRNDSVIDDLFKGQFKSTLRCHECDKISVKFDEFCCLSVPIPKDLKTVQVVFFWRDTLKRPKKFFIRVSADAIIEELKQQLSLFTLVSPAAIQIMETNKSKIHKIYGKGSSHLSTVPSDGLLAFEVVTEQEAGEPIIELAVTQRMTTPNPPNKCASCMRVQDIPTTGTTLKRCTKCYRVGYCNTTCQKNHWHHHKQNCKLVPEPVGSPFIMSLPESIVTYANLMQLAENYAKYSVDIFQPPVGQTQSTRRRQGSTSSGDISSDAEEMEVDSEGSGDAKVCEVEGGAYSGEDRAEADWPLGGGASGGPSDINYVAAKSSKVNRSNSLSSSSSGGEEIPLLSSSPKGKIMASQRTLTPVTRLFTLRPVNIRSPNMATPSYEPLNDKGAEPLNLRDTQFLAMDWCTNEKLPVRCLIQNKEIECEVEKEENIQKNKHTTIEACIDLFTQPENLSEGDSWRCPRCKKPVEATKQMSLWRLPSVLIIQLKRFSFKYVLYSDKIDKFVQYPIKNLDVGPFLSDGSTEGSAIYDLYGVINHMGRLLGGHYTAYCRTLDGLDTRQSEIDWRLCDDSRVNFVSDSRVVHEQAYLLLYRRRGDEFHLRAPAPIVPDKEAEENSSEEDDAFEGKDPSDELPKSQLYLEPMEESTPMSLSSVSQVSSSGSEPPSTVQEELD